MNKLIHFFLPAVIQQQPLLLNDEKLLRDCVCWWRWKWDDESGALVWKKISLFLFTHSQQGKKGKKEKKLKQIFLMITITYRKSRRSSINRGFFSISLLSFPFFLISIFVAGE